MFPLGLIPVFFVIALLAPTAWELTKVYRRSRSARQITCPEANCAATIQLNALHAAAMHARGDTARRVKACSLWPDRQGCQQACLR